MGTTIDSLDIQINTSAGNSAININKLANALGRLKQNSKLTSVTNNLTKLSTALDKLNSSSTSGINKLAQSLGSLSSFKASGFTSTANALNKIPKILDSLDTATLDKFKRKMEEVANSLAPLATRIDTIASGFSRLPNRISSVANATSNMGNNTRNMGEAVNGASLNLFTMISNFETLLHAVNFVADALSATLSQAIEWDGIQFRFGRAFGEDAEETYAWILKINEALGINIQEFMQYSSLYGSLLSGFGMAQEKVTAISVGLTELSYDIWAAYNDRFKSLEQASEAVRSAITGEIEPIRNAGIALTEASLQEFIDGTHLAGISIEKLTEAQKAEVRYAAMVDAAMSQGIVGTYAKEMHTAEGAVRSFSQSMKTLTQSFGSLFIPLLQVVVPYVTAFVEILTDAVHWVAELFGIELFKIDWSNTSKGVGGLADGATDAATGLGSAAKAAKKLKDYTMGFDELNVINPNSGSGSGGSGAGGAEDWGAGLDLNSLWDNALLEQASERVSELKKQILQFMDEWKWALIGIGVVLTGIAAHKAWVTLLGIGSQLVTKFTTVKNVITALWGAMTGSSAAKSALVFMFPIISKISTAFSSIGTFLSGIVAKLGAFIAGLSAGAIITVVAIVAAIASYLYFIYKNWNELTIVVEKFFAQNIAPKLEEIKKHFDKILDSMGPLGDWLKKIGKGIVDFFSKIDLKDILKGIGEVVEWLGGIIFYVVTWIGPAVINAVVGMFENIAQTVSGIVQIVSGFIDFIVALFSGGDVKAAWKKMWDGVVDVAKGIWGFLNDPIKDIRDGIVSWFSNMWKEVSNFFLPSKWKKKIDDVVDTIKKNFKLPSFPKIKLSVEWDKKVSGMKKLVTDALGLDGWPSLKWNTYAGGGSPSMGEMFIAREAGPELVGRIGSSSVVMNNDQIVAAVSQGVYSAVRAAMGGENGGSGQNVNVYLDGKQIYASVKKTEAQRGANLMGNQVGYLY